MASSLITNTLQVEFESVLSFSEEGMATMFKALESTGLRGSDLLQEEEDEEFRLLNDILAKSVTVKAGSFDEVTHERFLLMTAIHCGLKINWSKLLFDILKELVTPSSKQAIGFVVQICFLLQGIPDLALCEPKPFPTLKVLNVKTFGTYVAKQKSIDDGHEEDEPLAKKTAVKKDISKKRPAAPGITDSACKNQLVVVSVQYGPFNPYIPIRSTTIGKSRVVKDPIAMHTSWRSNSDIASVTRVSMTFRVVRTNQYNQDLGLIHSTNGNHLESPNEGSSIDHQVTIYLHAQNITMFPTNETWYFASQILVSCSGGLILILTAQSTRNLFRIHSDY
ncbi:hypothetical protein F511_25596 [Dorcoceras hygrometricum]|uniref:Uncharacterized protein n=1 Tax=Dorcoceras hygrometricum TaxID=472368 RepID=A0A2Z7CXD2_9LAMI|nr:hypothetical protein F511_25596 [Dorcoceras hygrometricum]